jgi:hypothetical protein
MDNKKEVYTGDRANEYGQRIARETRVMFEVRYDARRRSIVFLGTDILTSALQSGMDVEGYVTEKLAQARKHLVGEEN